MVDFSHRSSPGQLEEFLRRGLKIIYPEDTPERRELLASVWGAHMDSFSGMEFWVGENRATVDYERLARLSRTFPEATEGFAGLVLERLKPHPDGERHPAYSERMAYARLFQELDETPPHNKEITDLLLPLGVDPLGAGAFSLTAGMATEIARVWRRMLVERLKA